MTTADPPPVLIDRLRVSLVGTEPEIWRRLEVPDDLPLSELHHVLQIAFGWRQSGPHSFTDTEGQRWLDSGSVSGGPGRDDTGALLRDVLTPSMGPLLYGYGTDDRWEHLVELVQTGPVTEAEIGPRVVDGARSGPLEGTAGVEDHALLVRAWSDPDEEQHASARRWADETAGPWRRPFDPEAFDAATTQRGLTDRSDPSARSRWSPELTDLVSRAHVGSQPELAAHLGAAELDQSVVVQPADAEATTAAYRWLLHHVGPHGVRLNGGWLPPESVHQAAAALGWATHEAEAPDSLDGADADDADEAADAENAEDAAALMHLRQSAIRMGLLRKQKNTLQLTTLGYQLTDDPQALWWHLARRWLPTKRAGIERDAAILLAVDLATGSVASTPERLDAVAYGLDTLGWVNADDRGSVAPSDVQPLLGGDLALFVDLGLLTGDDRRASATPSGRLLARAMLSARPEEA